MAMSLFFKRREDKENTVDNDSSPEVSRWVSNGFQSAGSKPQFRDPITWYGDQKDENNALSTSNSLFNLNTDRGSYDIPEDQMQLALNSAFSNNSFFQTPKVGFIDPNCGNINSTGSYNSHISQPSRSNETIAPFGLRLREQYVFNVFEEIPESQDEEYKIKQHVGSTVAYCQPIKSLVSSVSPDSKTIPYYTFNLKFFLKILLASIALYFIYNTVSSFHADVDFRVKEELLAKKAHREFCSRNFDLNYCHDPVEGVTSACAEWKRCIESNPNYVERTPIVAKMTGQLIGGFFDGLEPKHMFYFTLGTAIIVTIGTGLAQILRYFSLN